jgi:hypothetical protein
VSLVDVIGLQQRLSFEPTAGFPASGMPDPGNMGFDGR